MTCGSLQVLSSRTVAPKLSWWRLSLHDKLFPSFIIPFLSLSLCSSTIGIWFMLGLQPHLLCSCFYPCQFSQPLSFSYFLLACVQPILEQQSALIYNSLACISDRRKFSDSWPYIVIIYYRRSNTFKRFIKTLSSDLSHSITTSAPLPCTVFCMSFLVQFLFAAFFYFLGLFLVHDPFFYMLSFHLTPTFCLPQ